MIRPVEMAKTLPMALHGGVMSTTTEVWEMLCASRDGDLDRVMQLGDIPKARLLLDHGADIHAVDEEYCSTPMGLAARWGQRKMAAFLLERGADPNRAGAAWATPLAWASKKGHHGVADDLIKAGAVANP